MLGLKEKRLPSHQLAASKTACERKSRDKADGNYTPVSRELDSVTKEVLSSPKLLPCAVNMAFLLHDQGAFFTLAGLNTATCTVSSKLSSPFWDTSLLHTLTAFSLLKRIENNVGSQRAQLHSVPWTGT